MKLYHGNRVRFDSFDLSKARPFKDFGKGIYFTPNQQQAEKLATGMNGAGFLYECSVHDRIFKDGSLEVLCLDRYTIEWLDYVSGNRNGLSQWRLYDIVYGVVADNKYKKLNQTIAEYYAGRIFAQKAIKLIAFPKNRKYSQYCFKTHKAITEIRIDKVSRVIRKGGIILEG